MAGLYNEKGRRAGGKGVRSRGESGGGEGRGMSPIET